jgi:hypothetical protein
MARSQPITRLEVASCPTHRTDVRHYAAHEEGNPLAEMAE